MGMRAVLDREGREAKNLVVYQFCDEEQPPAEGSNYEKINTFHKPPAAPPKSPKSPKPPTPTSTPCKTHIGSIKTKGPRLRSASTGRDKKSDLQARYWALLFGNLQRAVNEIYITVECCENISYCQETILVLENYVRDFKALGEWFKVSWEYDAKPTQQRPQSLAWEVRKSNPAPRVRAKSYTSPNVSGKSSPSQGYSNSGKSSPCCAYEPLSPRKTVAGIHAYEPLSKGAMRVNIKELFASSGRSPIGRSAEPEEDSKDLEKEQESGKDTLNGESQQETTLEVAAPLEMSNKCHQYAQTDMEEDHLTLADLMEKKAAELRRKQEQESEFDFEDEPFYINGGQRQGGFYAPAQVNCNSLEENFAYIVDGNLSTVVVYNAPNFLPISESASSFSYVNQAVPAENFAIEAPYGHWMHQPNSQHDVLHPNHAAMNGMPLVNGDIHMENGPEESESDENLIIAEPTAAEMTKRKLDAMENALLMQDAQKPPILPTTELQKIEIEENDIQQSKADTEAAAPKADRSKIPANAPKTEVDASKSEPSLSEKITPLQKSTTIVSTLVDAHNQPLKYSSVLNRPATARLPAKSLTPRASLPAVTVSRPQQVGLNKAPATRRLTAPRSAVELRQGITRSNTTLRPKSRTENYGPPNNVATRLSARSRTMVDISASRNDSKPTTNRAPAIRTPLGATSRKSSREDVATSITNLKAKNDSVAVNKPKVTQKEPPATKQTNIEANDGWLTVTNRRRSSMNWASRFDQPTGYASLPTLVVLDEDDKSEAPEPKMLDKKPSATKQAKSPKLQKVAEKVGRGRPEIKNAKAKVNSFPTQNKNTTPHVKQHQPTKSASVPVSKNGLHPPNRQQFIKRQKSDITGLKMTSLHKEYMRSEKNAQRKQNAALKQKLSENSSTETLVEGKKADPEDVNKDGDLHKIDIEIQTNRDFSKAIGDLYESISQMGRNREVNKVVDSDGILEGEESDAMTTTDTECDEDKQRLLVEEQESLERQIRELESSEIDIDTETDETDGEACILEKVIENDVIAVGELDDVFVDCADNADMTLEMRYQSLLSEMSWGERAEALATLELYVSRHPGRAQELHQKLSNPARRHSLHETLKRYQAKQARAQEKRDKLKQEKAVRIQQLLARVEDVKAAKNKLIEDKRIKMEDRLQRAAENRNLFLRQVVEKAHDEEKKLKEINFIKSIEAQNKRLDLIESSKETEVRLQDLEQERQKRLEEKAAKEAAAERRRQEMEKARLLMLEKMNKTRMEKEERIGKMQEQKEKQRQALAREKARDREERLQALQAQKQQSAEELQRKIQQKQEESARRHEENIEQIRQRALEMTHPVRTADEIVQLSEENTVALENGTGAEDGELSSTLSDVSVREHSRAYKKKLKKIKLRLSQSTEEYMQEMPAIPPHLRRESTISKYLGLVAKGGGLRGMERAILQLSHLIRKGEHTDYQCFLLLDGLSVITKHVIYKGIMDESSGISTKCISLAIKLYRNSCTVCPQINRHSTLGPNLPLLFEAIIKTMQFPKEKSATSPVELSIELMLACTVSLTPLYGKRHTHPKIVERLPDLISFAVIIGLLDNMSKRIKNSRESVEESQSELLTLLATIGMLTKFADLCPRGPADPTRFLSIVKSTEFFGVISMLTTFVKPEGEIIPQRTVSLVAATFNLLVSLAALDIETFQSTFAPEPILLQLIDLYSTLLIYCGKPICLARNGETEALLVDLIASIGFFCVNNKKNQDFLVSDQCSVVLKNLMKLPKQFESVVFPCLVTICYENQEAREVISRDFSTAFLDEYFKSDMAKKNRLITLIDPIKYGRK